MPVQTSQPSFPDSFPSFMSVFGGPLPGYKEEANTIHHLQYPTHVPVNTRLLPSPHRESVSSMTSASTESSPTTTISPFDSPGGGDISPSSSPESPSAMSVSYPKFMPSTRPMELPPRLAPVGEPRLSQPTPHNTRPDSPNRRARNLKNLSLRMPPPSQSRPPIVTASMVETSHHLDAPPAPIPIHPKTTKRRANLTIQTPTFNKPLSSITDAVPPTPSLRHAESSPSLLSITSPSFAPRGGMQLPRIISHPGIRRSSSASEDTTSPDSLNPVDGAGFSRRVLHGLEEEDDHPDSRESTRKKDRGYPDGPIRIHDSGVYLYLEPTAEEASKFDVVINVAKEVVNPFNTSKEERNDTVMSTWRNASMASKRFSRGEPQTAISEISFKSAWEFQPSDSESPTPTVTSPTPEPEYLHVGWDHNSEILEDLLPLCELIDDRIAEGKKVLVHCQLGASRSASLVIAYGLYKNRHLDFNSMYEAVKGRSQWVGPNMSLIYQLTDFRSKLMRGSTSKPPPQEWFVQTGRRSSEPQVARAERPASNESSRPSFRGLPQAPSISCLSIPETTSTRPTTSDSSSYKKYKSYSPKRSLSPRPLPFRQKFQSVEPASGRPRGLPRSVSSCDPLVQTHVFVRDMPDSGGMFSPRTNGFFSPTLAPSSFHRIDRPATLSPPPIPPADPRSPPSGGEPLIMRSIDEFL
ncbi:Protein-tyrosine/Dual-specificity phosphatase [Penicillium cf. griseofulvum]|uniref:protein-tyrosine-phosphatase n=1 Tax=Penicillium cf. griseofulvum TaxID=2972120 RepID=A0A9W9IWU7_9EURO|nr:Protein-tyrosine/Dual-specificity phosphatase [Penicillium cf. griseofulvum]KAJ5430130.1 Protein-tyrosine/Dual-specificity phosphatase [Penicillium cf. griseofulvum]